MTETHSDMKWMLTMEIHSDRGTYQSSILRRRTSKIWHSIINRRGDLPKLVIKSICSKLKSNRVSIRNQRRILKYGLMTTSKRTREAVAKDHIRASWGRLFPRIRHPRREDIDQDQVSISPKEKKAKWCPPIVFHNSSRNLILRKSSSSKTASSAGKICSRSPRIWKRLRIQMNWSKECPIFCKRLDSAAVL